MKKYNICVLGATGMVGKEMMKVLEERNFPVNKFLPLASGRTAGTKVSFQGKEYTVEEAKPESFDGIEIGLFSAGGNVSAALAPEAARRKCVVIDNTSHFRMDPEVPLIVPEVNGHAIKNHKGIIANPNCSTAQMVLALKPIHDAVGIERIIVSTYQSVSGWGKEAVEELMNQSRALLADPNAKVEARCIFKRIAFNVVPQIDQFTDNGYTKEELKMVNETKKIFEDESIKVTATTVRVPVVIGHSESVNITTRKKISAAEARKLMSGFADVKVMDDPAKGIYPTPIDCVGKNETLVGRVREDISQERGLEMWIVADNLRRGAALNAVLIAERMIKDGLI
ncbi:aspartate-semialdehyde dehydrogenase [candidate division WOR-1 bacterium RIFOXYA12_FULL_52_29]|uniref:Aspartate-semialdehyde dehydrogenase n=1 Tax=candidate division WOR-1 bacterium RIFOXYC12_FULL_54_18 TaxID=1802584 RepID=A0A1F4T609_UNCSA|nr:MAG: aspartate-semialdehyde dehydrogenase [candidate division WOR-1 bacterium RIFOXYA2_FULL_51_19]OGC17532.1 MAG: aspartate-semialdehyde dehydrogenase [candidate division WOR-1 bacterium RIFOXYA12_FULL_52_29]OGC26389.1 MAG: aspartate-semialdehyde dehydrogenase [candidate division WOR-1 bacterium RIFOXYB2_FULL_45_9]OGC27949.1 MAG: aspartate-semialdehyde dehydrogenase [candidate division WOR-1 bacterium RIFOXYC12_FULL_54_18]OGC29764.1 MAG: aspartate-semialdehyde dehydrogenase [candidate divisi